MPTPPWTAPEFETDAGVRARLDAISGLTAAAYHDRFAAAAARHGAVVRRLANGTTAAVFQGDSPQRLSMMSGLHGDERSGPVALLDFLERSPPGVLVRPGLGVWVAPLLNDVGWDENTREWTATNLNRAFLPGVAPPFLQEVMDELAARRPDLYLDLHEDSTRDYAYVYRYTEDRHDLAARLEELLDARDVPWGPDSLVQWKGPSEVFVRRLGCDRAATLEVPPVWPLARRARWFLRAVDYCLGTPS